jgi:hypothetical protein
VERGRGEKLGNQERPGKGKERVDEGEWEKRATRRKLQRGRER